MGGDHPSAIWTWSHFGVAQSVSDRAISVGSPDQHLVISRTVFSGMADDVTREANQWGRPADLVGAGQATQICAAWCGPGDSVAGRHLRL